MGVVMTAVNQHDENIEMLTVGRRRVGPRQSRMTNIQSVAPMTADSATESLREGENLNFIASRSPSASNVVPINNRRRRARARRVEVALPAQPDKHGEVELKMTVHSRSKKNGVNVTEVEQPSVSTMRRNRPNHSRRQMNSDAPSEVVQNLSEQSARRSRFAQRALARSRSMKSELRNRQENQTKHESDSTNQIDSGSTNDSYHQESGVVSPQKSSRVRIRARGATSTTTVSQDGVEDEAKTVVNVRRRRARRRQDGPSGNSNVETVSIGPRRSRGRRKWRERGKAGPSVKNVEEETLDM